MQAPWCGSVNQLGVVSAAHVRKLNPNWLKQRRIIDVRHGNIQGWGWFQKQLKEASSDGTKTGLLSISPSTLSPFSDYT